MFYNINICKYFQSSKKFYCEIIYAFQIRTLFCQIVWKLSLESKSYKCKSFKCKWLNPGYSSNPVNKTHQSQQVSRRKCSCSCQCYCQWTVWHGGWSCGPQLSWPWAWTVKNTGSFESWIINIGFDFDFISYKPKIIYSFIGSSFQLLHINPCYEQTQN